MATNKSIEYTNVILKGLGAHHFQCIVGGDNGFGLKPEPGMLLHVMEQLNVSKEQICACRGQHQRHQRRA